MTVDWQDFIREYKATAPEDERMMYEAECKSIGEQIAEDTCDEHAVWCCEHCFDMTPIKENDMHDFMFDPSAGTGAFIVNRLVWSEISFRTADMMAEAGDDSMADAMWQLGAMMSNA